MNPKISLDQWRALLAVVDHGGFAQAAQALHKSQSAVSYGIHRLEELLGVEVFQMQGRKAMLTDAGRTLYRRARQVLDEAVALERAAGNLAAGWEPEIRIAVDVVFPTWLILRCLDRLGDDAPDTRVELLETVLTGAQEALLDGRVDLAITGTIPKGFLADPLMRVRFLAVAHPDHPLNQLDRAVTAQDLKQYRQMVVRDSGQNRRDSGWLAAEHRWTVTNMTTSIGAVCRGYGFAWLPEYKIYDELRQGILKPLPLDKGAERFVETYLVLADPDGAGPAVRRLAEIIRDGVQVECAAHTGTDAAG